MQGSVLRTTYRHRGRARLCIDAGWRDRTATKKLASRARHRVPGTRTIPDADLGRHRHVVDAFLAAAPAATSTPSSRYSTARPPIRSPRWSSTSPMPSSMPPLDGGGAPLGDQLHRMGFVGFGNAAGSAHRELWRHSSWAPDPMRQETQAPDLGVPPIAADPSAARQPTRWMRRSPEAHHVTATLPATTPNCEICLVLSHRRNPRSGPLSRMGEDVGDTQSSGAEGVGFGKRRGQTRCCRQRWQQRHDRSFRSNRVAAVLVATLRSNTAGEPVAGGDQLSSDSISRQAPQSPSHNARATPSSTGSSASRTV
jgi:hypothetical protein